MKIALGLQELDTKGMRPSKSRMKDDFGHGVVEMDLHVRNALRPAVNDAPRPTSLLTRLDEDPVLPPLLAVFDRYGHSGRFYYLDELASKPQDADSPIDMWNRVESEASNREPDIRHRYHSALSPYDNNAFEASVTELRGAIADSLLAWWEAIRVAGRFGAYGGDGSVMGFEVHPRLSAARDEPSPS